MHVAAFRKQEHSSQSETCFLHFSVIHVTLDFGEIYLQKTAIQHKELEQKTILFKGDHTAD